MGRRKNMSQWRRKEKNARDSLHEQMFYNESVPQQIISLWMSQLLIESAVQSHYEFSLCG